MQGKRAHHIVKRCFCQDIKDKAENTAGVVPYLRAWLFREDRPDLLEDFDEQSREFFPDL